MDEEKEVENEEVIDEDELEDLLEEVKGEEPEKESEETSEEEGEIEIELEPETQEEEEKTEIEEKGLVGEEIKPETIQPATTTSGIKLAQTPFHIRGLVEPVCSIEKAIEIFKKFEEAKRRVLTKNDIMWIGDDGAPTVEGQGTPYIKRSGWRKLARFFGLSWSIEDVKEIKTENGYLYQAKVKIWHPAGASVEAVGVATSEDKFFTKGGKREANKGNVLMKAITVALNRGISDILGSGEVSVEETE